MGWWKATREVVQCEWQLLRGHPRLALACAGLLFVPALYAWIYLYAMWDPAAHTRELPAGLVNLGPGRRSPAPVTARRCAHRSSRDCRLTSLDLYRFSM